MKISSLISVLVFATMACSSKPVAPEKVEMVKAPTTLEEAVASLARNPEMVKRDQYRHPVETLKFFGVEPQMTVVEIAPSNGWYTQILAPLLNEKGQYIAAQVPSHLSDYMKSNNDQRNAWLQQNSTMAAKTQTVDFNPPQDIVPENSADVVLTFRNVHNWMSNKNQDAAFKAFFKALKPGGVLGVVEHRADSKKKQDPKAKSGYVREDHVIKLATKAGFKLADKSEINGNPKDNHTHPEGVWTLPPVLKLKDKDREKYLAIGESDRMTLKFVKPVKK